MLWYNRHYLGNTLIPKGEIGIVGLQVWNMFLLSSSWVIDTVVVLHHWSHVSHFFIDVVTYPIIYLGSSCQLLVINKSHEPITRLLKGKHHFCDRTSLFLLHLCSQDPCLHLTMDIAMSRWLLAKGLCFWEPIQLFETKNGTVLRLEEVWGILLDRYLPKLIRQSYLNKEMWAVDQIYT